MKAQIHLFLTAVMFLTRIPVPEIEYSQGILNRSSRYFPLVGVLVGSICALTYYLSSLVFSPSISVIISMAVSLLVTGAFHEDGFADFCDGFGGGTDKAKILSIMKDSRIGSFGAIGIAIIMFLKYQSLSELKPAFMTATLITGHAFSRFLSISILYTMEYVREEDGKSKPLALGMELESILIAFLTAVLPLFLFKTALVSLAIVPPVLATLILAKIMQNKIGGFTGDCLGAVQSVAEVAFYLSVLAIFKWRFI